MKLRGSLGTGERVILATRAHPLALLSPALCLLGAAVLASFASSLMPVAPLLAYLALLPALWLALLALTGTLRWVTGGYLLTNQRLVIQRGLLRPRQQNLALTRIEGAKARLKPLIPGQQGELIVYYLGRPVVLDDVPQVKAFSHHLYRAHQAAEKIFNFQ